MQKEFLEKLDRSKWYHIRLKSGQYYKARIVVIRDGGLEILDRFGAVSYFDLDGIDSISEWRKDSSK